MGKCKYCGEKIDDGAVFCPFCGKQLKQPPKEKVKTVVKTVQKKVVDKAAVSDARSEGIQAAFNFLAALGMDFSEEIDGEIPLVHAADMGDAEMVQALLDAGADVDAVDSDSNTALHKACENGDNKIAKILLDNNADVDMENDYGETPLSLARANGSRYMVGLLHKSGAVDDDDDA